MAGCFKSSQLAGDRWLPASGLQERGKRRKEEQQQQEQQQTRRGSSFPGSSNSSRSSNNSSSRREPPGCLLQKRFRFKWVERSVPCLLPSGREDRTKRNGGKRASLDKGQDRLLPFPLTAPERQMSQCHFVEALGHLGLLALASPPPCLDGEWWGGVGVKKRRKKQLLVFQGLLIITTAILNLTTIFLQRFKVTTALKKWHTTSPYTYDLRNISMVK